jgi:hypothetical protein
MSDPTDMSWWFGQAGGPAPSNQYQDRSQIQGIINSGLQGIDNRRAPQTTGAAMSQAAQLDPTQQAQFRQMQMNQANQLAGIAGGQQQGAGELAAQRQVSNALAGQMAMARMARGANAGAAQLGAARQSAGIGITGAGMGQQAAMQDQMNAQGMLSNALSGARGQDIGMAGQNAGFQQQTNLANQSAMNQQQLANLNAQLQTMGMNDQARLGYLQQLTGMDANQLQASMQAYGLQQQNTGMFGSLLSAGGQIGAAYLGMPKSPSSPSGGGGYAQFQSGPDGLALR